MAFLLAGSLFSCKEEAPTKVALDFGTYVGNQADDLIDNTSQLRWIKRSKVDQLIREKDSFLLLVHGSADECTCFTQWHNTVLAPYIKRNKLLVYAITLKEFETGTDYLGVLRISGSDTLCVFQSGTLRYQKDTSDQQASFVKDYAAFSTWMKERTENPKIYYVSFEILDEFYGDFDPFTIYFGRDNCPDCAYLKNALLKDYLHTKKIVDDRFLYVDFDAVRPSKDDEDYEAKMVTYAQTKAKYGLSEAEDNPAGMGEGVFPTIYYVRPNGKDYTGEVIESAGVFFNEMLGKDGKISGRYFTKERYDAAKETYLSYVADDAALTSKWIEGDILKTDTPDRHEALKPYEAPFFNALLNYCVLDQ